MLIKNFTFVQENYMSCCVIKSYLISQEIKLFNYPYEIPNWETHIFNRKYYSDADKSNL